MNILSYFLVIMILPINQPPPELFFEFKSQGTMSRQNIHVLVYADGNVHYMRTAISPAKTLEEWTGKLNDTDYKVFVNEIINNCKFMDLPQKPDEEIRIKDGSFDDITVSFNTRKHIIGGYGANHYPKYKCVYQSYNQMTGKISNIKYKVKP